MSDFRNRTRDRGRYRGTQEPPPDLPRRIEVEQGGEGEGMGWRGWTLFVLSCWFLSAGGLFFALASRWLIQRGW